MAPGASGHPSQSETDFTRVASRVEASAEEFCRERPRGGPPGSCAIRFIVSGDGSEPPNAFQSLASDGTPLVTMTASLLAQVRDDTEIAAVLSHEAAHHVGGHVARMNANGPAPAFLPRFEAAFLDGSGAESQIGDYGAGSGARARGRALELEADWIGTFIAERSGYDPAKGTGIYTRSGVTTGRSAKVTSSHPALSRRLEVIQAARSEVQRQRAAGLTPRLHYADTSSR
jgi:Zn-dependent protease with chaperone function